MVKRTWWIAWLLATTLLLLSVSSVFAATATTNTGFKIWPAKTTSEVNKVWTISFNAPLLSSSVNSKTVYVTDSKQTKVETSTKLAPDGFSVTVTSSKAYTGGDYNLFVTNGVRSWNGLQLSETIIVPFTVIVPSVYSSYVSLVVTVTDDFKAVLGDLSGVLSLEGKSGTRLAPSAMDLLTGKYTFNIYTEDEYSLKMFSVSEGVFNTQSIKVPTVKIPITKPPATATIVVKTMAVVISSRAGVDGGKAGSIGGSIDPAKWGVPVKVSNATTTWTTSTDIDGKFVVYLPAGSYQLIVDGNDVQYKEHSYKLTVVAGQMASPQDPIKGEELE